MIVEINTDGIAWPQVKHALREAGYKVFLQPILFDNARANLFLDRRTGDPEGHLSHGFIVHDGGARTHIEMPEEVVHIVDKPAAKSSTSVLNASVCQSCGCKLDGQPLKRPCSCRCHVDGPR